MMLKSKPFFPVGKSALVEILSIAEDPNALGKRRPGYSLFIDPLGGTSLPRFYSNVPLEKDPESSLSRIYSAAIGRPMQPNETMEINQMLAKPFICVLRITRKGYVTIDRPISLDDAPDPSKEYDRLSNPSTRLYCFGEYNEKNRGCAHCPIGFECRFLTCELPYDGTYYDYLAMEEKKHPACFGRSFREASWCNKCSFVEMCQPSPLENRA
jgi:hypothetical protein